jgi:NAD(P)H dehydrogenase (quinone)
MKTYGITGATGQLGRKVVTSLAGKVSREQIVAIARDPSKAADLRVAARAGDYADLGSLKRAFSGLDTLLLISSSSLETRQSEHANVIQAAQEAGVRRILYTSLLHAERWKISFADDHLATEQWIKSSGLDFTILRNGWYWENHTAGLPHALDYGGLISSAGTGRISWASRQDYADAAVSVLTQDLHSGKTYELAGVQAHTLEDLAAEVARQTGRAFTYRSLTEDQHAVFLESAGLPKPLAAVLAQIDSRGVSQNVLEGTGAVLQGLIGRPSTALSAAVAEAFGL